VFFHSCLMLSMPWCLTLYDACTSILPGFDLMPESPRFNSDWKNCDPGSKFLPKMQPGCFNAILHFGILIFDSESDPGTRNFADWTLIQPIKTTAVAVSTFLIGRYLEDHQLANAVELWNCPLNSFVCGCVFSHAWCHWPWYTVPVTFFVRAQTSAGSFQLLLGTIWGCER